MASEKTDRLRPLAEVTGMIFDNELMKLKEISRREQELRSTLAELSERSAQRFLSSVADAGASVKVIEGQDRAWRDWVSLRREELQRQLARVLAEKSEHMDVLTRSLGRREVADKLLAAQLTEDRRDRRNRQMLALQALSLMMGKRRE